MADPALTRLYKKQSLKFSNNEVSRNSRHAETLRARESSRFKRLSMLRSLDEETENEEKVVENKKCNEKKKPSSRLEMLFKWKQEKEIKKELDKKSTKRPFYVGKSNPNTGLSSVTQSNVNFNTSKVAKSKLTGIPMVSSNLSKGIPAQKTKNQVSFTRIPKSGGKELDTKLTTGIKTNIKPLKAKSQESSLPKPNFAKPPSKPVLRTGIPTVSSNLPRGISAQKTKSQVAPCLTENVTNRKKGYSFKTVPSKHAGRKEIPDLCLEKKMEQKNKSNSGTKGCKDELLSKQGLKNGESKIFDCDISIITPSFAPPNFKFMPPAGLNDVSFDDAFERVKPKIISRTSTPSKPCSPVAEAACNDSPLMDNLNPVPKISESSDVSVKNIRDHSVCKEVEDKVDLPNEKKDECAIKSVDPFLDVSLGVDIDKIREIIIKHKKLMEQEELHTDNDNLLSERENELPSKVSEDAIVNSPFDIVDLNKTEDLCLKPDGSMKLDNDNLWSEKENELPSKVLVDARMSSPFDIVDLNKTEDLCLKSDGSMKLDKDDTDKDDLLSKKENIENTKVSEDACVDSPLEIVDLNKIEEMSTKNTDFTKLEEDELTDYDLFNQQSRIEKPLGKSVHQKRTSMLKNIPTLNSIAEIAETDVSTSQTPVEHSENKKTSVVTSRRSQRLSKLVIQEENLICSSAVTPRRSSRLQNVAARKCQFEDAEIFSPKSKSNPRRSMRLIDLNTPDKEITDSGGKTNITADFEKLTLLELENVNPHATFIDFDYSPGPKPKSKKISLLYSPEKVRKSMRKSIKGDLMVFSPSN